MVLIFYSSTDQEKYNGSHIYHLKFSSSHFKEKKQTTEINLIFMQSNTSKTSICNQYAKSLKSVFILYFQHISSQNNTFQGLTAPHR